MNSGRNIVKVGQNVIQYDVIVTDSAVQIKASLMCILWFLHRDFFPLGWTLSLICPFGATVLYAPVYKE